MHSFEKILSAERFERLAKRREARKEERRQRWIKEKEEAEQRKKDEELKRSQFCLRWKTYFE